MARTTIDWDPYLHDLFVKAIDWACRENRLFINEIFGRGKHERIMTARLVVIGRLRSSIEQIDKYAGGYRAFYRVHEHGKVVWTQPGVPPHLTNWRPLSTTKIATLMNLDHSAVISYLNQLTEHARDNGGDGTVYHGSTGTVGPALAGTG